MHTTVQSNIGCCAYMVLLHRGCVWKDSQWRPCWREYSTDELPQEWLATAQTRKGYCTLYYVVGLLAGGTVAACFAAI